MRLSRSDRTDSPDDPGSEPAPIPPHFPDPLSGTSGQGSSAPQGPGTHPPISPGQLPAAGGLSLAGFKAVFRIPDFRRLFWGQAISALGDWVGTFAFIVAAEQLAPDQPVAVGGILVIRLIPSFFATPIGGVLSDRWDRKRIMIASDVARFFVILAVPLIPRLGALYAFAFVMEALSLVFLPARDASLPNVIGKENLEAANALIMGSSFGGIPLSAPIFAGLAWAGLHYPTWLPYDRPIRAHSFSFAFVFDAFTYLVSAAMIWRMSVSRARPAPGAEPEPFWESLADGVRYIAARPFILGLAVAVSSGMLGGGVLFAVGVGYVNETLAGGSVEFGWLMGLFGAGMVSGFVASQVRSPRGIAWMIRGSLVAMGAVLGFMSIVSVLWIAYILAVVFGTSFAVSVILGMSAVQARSDDAVRGRVMAAVHMLVRVALSLGALGGGAIASLVPARGLHVPGVPYHPDRNQLALAIAGALIAAGSLGVRAPSPSET